MTPTNRRKLLHLIKAIIQQESGGNPNAVSKAGAKGLMQLMDATGKEWHGILKIQESYNPFNPRQNKKIGKAYFIWLLKQFNGDVKLALSAYNGGIGRIKKLLEANKAKTFDEIVPALANSKLDETLKYVPSVLKRCKLKLETLEI
jgi:soluble lytic murein transglycosylase-like protein